MASPVGHAIAGVTCAAAVSAAAGAPAGVTFWLGAIVAAGAPDLDFAPWLLGVGTRRYHRGPSHSLLVIGALVACVLLVWRGGGMALDGRSVTAWSAALLTHPVLDLLATGPRSGRRGAGVALFWPLSRRRRYLRHPLFEQDGRWLRCRSPRCLLGLLRSELIWLGPPCAVASLLNLLR
jgi:membrane-bound metal-dependent hydrolase YbcI (DUF457 family)